MPHINYCDTCAHWTREAPPNNYRGTCGNAKLHDFGAYTGCMTEEDLSYSYHEGGTILTGQSFGCVHHSNMDATVVEAILAEDEALYGEDL